LITANDIDSLKFTDGLIPAVVQDAGTKRVLTLAYMNRESLKLTLDEGRTVFWSRSRGEIWRKGETSGNVQLVVDIEPDCDGDALLVQVAKGGPACHTGRDSCFDEPESTAAPNCDGSEKTVEGAIEAAFGGATIIDDLYSLLKDRKANPKEGSYTTYLFEKGLDKILKKVGEESTEVIIAAKAGDKTETIYEIADLAYHTLTLMVNNGISPEEIRAELSSRHVVDKKVKQEKMT